jgi:hypothetical protein
LWVELITLRNHALVRWPKTISQPAIENARAKAPPFSYLRSWYLPAAGEDLQSLPVRPEQISRLS